MTVHQLIADLRSEGIALAAVAGKVRVTPRDERAAIRAHRDELLQLLEDEAAPAPPPLADLVDVAIGDMTPPEHWAAIGGDQLLADAPNPMGRLSARAMATSRRGVLRGLRAAQHVYQQRDGPGQAPFERDYHRLWTTYATGDTA